MAARKAETPAPRTGGWYVLKMRERYLARDGAPPRERLFTAGEQVVAMRLTNAMWATDARFDRGHFLTDDQVDVLAPFDGV
jgi:hypothetical protein